MPKIFLGLIVLLYVLNQNSIERPVQVWHPVFVSQEQRNLELSFIRAAKEGDVKTFNECLEARVNINAADNDGFTALIRASQAFIWSDITEPFDKKDEVLYEKIKLELKNKLEMVRKLLSKGANIILEDKIMKWNALQWAEKSNNKDVIEIIQKQQLEYASKEVKEICGEYQSNEECFSPHILGEFEF